MKTFDDFGIELNGQTGAEVRTICPVCSSTRKKSREKCLAVNTEKGTWFCHHCGHTGGLGGNPEPKYERPTYTAELNLPETVISWFEKRGIGKATLEANQIGYGMAWMPGAGKETSCIQFPFNKGGETVNIKFRDCSKNFRQSKGAEKVFYRFDFIGDPLIVTEGEIDALSLVEAGFHKIVSCPDGAPPENAKHYGSKFDFLKSAESKLKAVTKIILAVDNDKPGKILEEELARRLGKERCWRVAYPSGCKDANDVLVKHGKEALKQVIKTTTPYPVEGLFQPNDLKADVVDLYEHGIELGHSTGWKKLDRYFTVRPGELTIVSGIPGSGKSNFLDALMLNLVSNFDWPFAICSPENWPLPRHMQTLLEKVNRKPFFEAGKKSPRMTQGEVESGIDLVNRYFHFIMPEESDLTVDNILAKAKTALLRHGIKGLIIDPWNELEHNYTGLTETQYISRELTKIRRFAKLNGVHVWIVAHPKNLTKGDDGTYKVPTMYEISGGANWRNKADNGLCIHRPNMRSDEVKVYIQKIRFRDVGMIGETSLFFDRDTGCYSE